MRQSWGPLTVFGAQVLSLALAHGIRTIKELETRMKDENDIPLNHERLYPYLYGVHSVPSWICTSIAEAIEASEDERVRLAMAYAYGQNRKIGPGWRDEIK